MVLNLNSCRYFYVLHWVIYIYIYIYIYLGSKTLRTNVLEFQFVYIDKP